jgi:hypothetical protein
MDWSGGYGVSLSERSPIPGQQFVQAGCGLVSDAAQDVGEPSARVDAV